jgi:quercetin 2,3-dioxygenase
MTPITEVHYLDIDLDADARSMTHSAAAAGTTPSSTCTKVPSPSRARAVDTHQLAVLHDGDGVVLEAGSAGARVILVAGRPIGEPVVQYGPFVMNRQDEIEQAFRDYQSGNLVRTRASMQGQA